MFWKFKDKHTLSYLQIVYRVEDWEKYETEDISKQTNLSQHKHYTFSTTDTNMEIRNKPHNYEKHAVGVRKWTVGSHFTCQFYNNRTYWITSRWSMNSPTILPGQHNKITHHIDRYPPRLSTCQTSTLTTSTRHKCIFEYIQYAHDIISIYPYNNIHIYCRLYMQPQIHTACTRDDYVEQILLYHWTTIK
jgi:hypothetical protein